MSYEIWYKPLILTRFNSLSIIQNLKKSVYQNEVFFDIVTLTEFLLGRKSKQT